MLRTFKKSSFSSFNATFRLRNPNSALKNTISYNNNGEVLKNIGRRYLHDYPVVGFDCCINCKFVDDDKNRCNLRKVDILDLQTTHCKNFLQSVRATKYQIFKNSTKSVKTDLKTLAVDLYYQTEEYIRSGNSDKIQELDNKIKSKKSFFIVYYAIDPKSKQLQIVGGYGASSKLLNALPLPTEDDDTISKKIVNSKEFEIVTGSIPGQNRKLPPIIGPLMCSDPALLRNLFKEHEEAKKGNEEDMKRLEELTEEFENSRVPYDNDARPSYTSNIGRCKFCGIQGETKVSLQDKTETMLFCSPIHYASWWKMATVKKMDE